MNAIEQREPSVMHPMMHPVHARNSALLAAESARARAVHEAQVEYAETICKLREHFDAELRAAAAALRHATLPAHKAYNSAVIAAEALAVISS